MSGNNTMMFPSLSPSLRLSLKVHTHIHKYINKYLLKKSQKEESDWPSLVQMSTSGPAGCGQWSRIMQCGTDTDPGILGLEIKRYC